MNKILSAVHSGKPVYVMPYKCPKVWGLDGIGEYWYGAEEGGKSSTVVVGEDTISLCEVVKSIPGPFLGEKVVARFGARLPLVKILTPRSRLSVQFHDAKNELWIVTGTDMASSGGKPWIIVGFSRESVGLYGKDVTKHYKKCLESYGEALNDLIDIMIGNGHEKPLEEKKDVVLAADKIIQEGPGPSDVSKACDRLKDIRKKLDSFYNIQYVEIGDVIPVPSGTLHALGPGVEVIEPQIPGPTQSLEDGATYPVRYAFPNHPREGAEKLLDIDRVCEVHSNIIEKSYPEIVEESETTLVVRMQGGFEDKGLEVHRITFKKSTIYHKQLISSFHTLVAIKGEGKVVVNEEEYNVPIASRNGNMLIIPASAGNFNILADENTQIIDTFTPV